MGIRDRGRRLWCRLRRHDVFWIDRRDGRLSVICERCASRSPGVVLDYPPPRVRFDRPTSKVQWQPANRPPGRG